MMFSSDLLKDVRLQMRRGVMWADVRRRLRLSDVALAQAIRQAFADWKSV